MNSCTNCNKQFCISLLDTDRNSPFLFHWTVNLPFGATHLIIQFTSDTWNGTAFSSPPLPPARFFKVWPSSRSPPASTPSPFSPLKSPGHVRFIRNDKCCSLAVPLQNSHLSGLRTFHSCQLFHLARTQILHNIILVGGGEWGSPCLAEAL